MASPESSQNRRWAVTQRVLASVFLGYILANTLGLMLALGLPVDRLTGILIGTLATFVVWAAAIMWIFAQKSNVRVWLGLLAAIAITGAMAYGLFLLNPVP